MKRLAASLLVVAAALMLCGTAAAQDKRDKDDPPRLPAEAQKKLSETYERLQAKQEEVRDLRQLKQSPLVVRAAELEAQALELLFQNHFLNAAIDLKLGRERLDELQLQIEGGEFVLVKRPKPAGAKE